MTSEASRTPSASSSVLKYLYGQEGFFPDISSKGSLLPCELISACHPSENTKNSFFIFLAFLRIARLLSPLTSVLSSLVLNWKPCSCPSQVLFWALAHALHRLQGASDFSLCCSRTRPSSGEKLWLLSGRVSHVSHSKGSSVCHGWQSFPPLPFWVQSFSSMCRTLCYCLLIPPSSFFSRIFPQTPHSLWILMQLSNSSPAVHANNLMSSTLFNNPGNPHRTSALLMMVGIYWLTNHAVYCFPSLCSCRTYLLSPMWISIWKQNY